MGFHYGRFATSARRAVARSIEWPRGLPFMDVSELRKRILRAIDEAKKDVSARRGVQDAAARAYEQFLETIAVPLLRQSAIVLKASGQLFDVHTPAGSVR